MSNLHDLKKRCDAHLAGIESILYKAEGNKPLKLLLGGIVGFLRDHVEKAFEAEGVKAAKPVAMSDDETTQADVTSAAKPSA